LPWPSGYSGDGGRSACFRPSSSSSWLPQSASECTVSASMALERVKYAATPLATAIAKLAPSANRIAREELPAIVIPSSGPGRSGYRPGVMAVFRRGVAARAPLLQEQGADAEGGLVGLGVVAVAEQDHRQPLFRPAHHDVAETDGLARVPDGIAGDAQAEAVGGLVGFAGDAHVRCEGERTRRIREQAVVVHGGVPAREVVDRGIDAAVAEHRAGGALVGALPAFAVGAVAPGAVRDVGAAGDVGDAVVHAQRLEDALAQELRVGHPGGLLHDQREQRVGAVAVAVVAAGREVQPVLALEELEHPGVADLALPVVAHEVLVVHQPGGVGE